MSLCCFRGLYKPKTQGIPWLVLILLLGYALRVAYLTVDRFHADEALYAGWALSITDSDPLLLGVPVDKPPLYLYALACSLQVFGRSEVAARQLSLAASLLSIALVYRLGRRLYSASVGIWAALMLALSPFDILFARTAFTDSMLTLWTMAGLCAISTGHWLATGVFLGLAFATKQHALLTIPLVLLVGLLQHGQDSETKGRRLRSIAHAALTIGLGFAVPFLGVTAWDAARWATRPGYWQQSAASYGGLVWVPITDWGARWLEWMTWARYLVGSPLLAALTILSVVALLISGWLHRPQERHTWYDTLWIAYLLVYLFAHTVLQFSIWDRYLLPLAPLVALLLARTVALVSARRPDLQFAHEQLPRLPLRRLSNRLYLVVPSLFLLLALVSGYRAARNGYPIGGEHWAYQGLDKIAAYLKENAPPDAVLYHHWLRWHYSYYLYGTSFELRWWESGEHMQREALRTPERTQYVVLPDWRTLEPEAPELYLELLYQARRKDQSVSLSLYRVRPRLSGQLLERVL